MAIKIENDQVFLTVRDLVPATQNHEMLSSFPLPQRGALGRQAQTWLQKGKKGRHGLFHSEFIVNQTYHYRKYSFHISGRIDGVYQLQNRAEIEEIKSVILKKTAFKQVSADLYPHFNQQLLFYAYLLQDELQGLEIIPYLVLINLVDYKDRIFNIAYQREAVENLLFERFNAIINEIEAQENEIRRRRAELDQINFHLAEERPQQKQMMQYVKTALINHEHLMVSAPTGTGKTAAALYPAIQYAYANNKKILFVTSKGSQQEIVKETLQRLLNQGLNIKVSFLKASRKMCANDIFFCHQAHCPYAKNYRQRLEDSGIISKLLDMQSPTPEEIFFEASNNELCPFEVNMDLAVHSDVLVGDYNYVFDPSAQLRRLYFKKDYSDWILIIDEAHNLPDRGMSYLSPQIKRQTLLQLMDLVHSKKQKIYKALHEALQKVEEQFHSLQQEGESSFEGSQYFETQLNLIKWEDIFSFFESAYIAYLIYKVQKGLLIIDDPLESFYFGFRRFLQVARFRETEFVTFYNAAEGGILNIQCCDPSQHLGQIIDRFHSVVAMSATLDPIHYYHDVMGFPKECTNHLELDSPFPKENKKVIIVPNISTRYKDRINNYQKIADIIKESIKIKPGNYLVFFPSYDFMQNVNLFMGNLQMEKIMQKPAMTDSSRDEVLNQLKAADNNLLMAVMGGIFSEGVDFSGDMAIGVFVVSPALPKYDYERDLLFRYYENKTGMGKEYAYVYPGMNKVIQSVGRLIRSYSDKGIVMLIGARFAEDEFNRLMPSYWFAKKGDIIITNNYKAEIKNFWKSLIS